MQAYIDGPIDEFHSPAFGDDEMGKSVAIDLVRATPANGREGECSGVSRPHACCC